MSTTGSTSLQQEFGRLRDIADSQVSTVSVGTPKQPFTSCVSIKMNNSPNPIPSQVNERFCRALMVVLLQDNLCGSRSLCALELISSSMRAFLEDCLYYAWINNLNSRRAMFGSSNKLGPIFPVSHSHRLKWAKLSYIERFVHKEALVELGHHSNKRIVRNTRALRSVKEVQEYRKLDILKIYPRDKFGDDKVCGMLCDLAILPDPRLARVLSIKRASAMTVIVTDSIHTTLAVKSHLMSIGAYPGFSFIQYAGDTTRMASQLRFDRDSRPDMSSEPGFIGYASDLFEFREGHEFLRESVFEGLFGSILVFETVVQCQAAWDRASQNGTFDGLSVSFLALDTYDDLELKSDSEDHFVWTYRQHEGTELDTNNGQTSVLNANSNPLQSPKTSSMLTADERNCYQRNLSSQDVIMFSSGDFRKADSMSFAHQKMCQVVAAKENLTRQLYGGLNTITV